MSPSEHCGHGLPLRPAAEVEQKSTGVPGGPPSWPPFRGSSRVGNTRRRALGDEPWDVSRLASAAVLDFGSVALVARRACESSSLRAQPALQVVRELNGLVEVDEVTGTFD